MPVISAPYEELVALIGQRISKETLIERVPMMGGAFEGERTGTLDFEFFPNRPDLLSVEGLARACRAFFDVKPGFPHYRVEAPSETVEIDAHVAKIRPVLGFCRVKNVALDDARLAELIELQERLTVGPGRKRRKVAIGIHDAAQVRGPFRYQAVKPDAVRFVPLQMSKELTPKEILEQHEKGRLYRHLVEGHDRVPLIVDGDGQVLSMPPVINGQLTALTTRTREVIVDVTGTEERTVLGVLNIVATSLAERGGALQAFTLRRGTKQWSTPDLSPIETVLPLARVTELLGIKPTPAEAAAYLGRMGHEFEAKGEKSGTVRTPAWRLDILHPDDLVEDVGIGYGFDRFTPRLPTAAQFGGMTDRAKRLRKARTALLGLGFTEVLTLTLTGKPDAFDRIGAPARPVVEVLNALTEDHTLLRPSLFPSLLGILRANKHRELPQAIFEAGLVVPDASGPQPTNQLRVAGLRMAARASFAECKGVVEALLRDLARPAEVQPGATAGFLDGRCGRLVHEGAEVGFFGEVHPRTLEAYELGAPCFGFEIHL